jgi:hypothetical protein
MYGIQDFNLSGPTISSLFQLLSCVEDDNLIDPCGSEGITKFWCKQGLSMRDGIFVVWNAAT